MTERPTPTYRDSAAETRRRAQDTLKALRAERVAKRAARLQSKKASSGAVAPAVGAILRSKPGPQAAQKFTAAPETAAIVSKSAPKRRPANRTKAATSKKRPTKTAPTSTAVPASLREEIDANLEKLSSLCADTEDTRSKLKSLKSELADSRKEFRELTKLMKSNEADLHKTNRALADAQSALSVALEERKELRTELDTLTKARAEAEKALAKQQAASIDHEKELAKLRQAVEASSTELSTLRQQLAADRVEAASLKTERQQLEATIPSLKGEAELAEERRDKAVEEADSLGAELQDIRERLSEDQENLGRVAAERVATERALVETLASFSKERRKLENLRLQLSAEGLDAAKTNQAEALCAPKERKSDLALLPEIGEGMIWHLNKAGIETLVDLAMKNVSELRDELGALGELADLDSWVKFAQDQSASA